ncbi:protein of unknown function [Burkholderia multivorans]
MAIVYSNPNQQDAESIAIRQEIRASNAKNIARRREQDDAARKASACRIRVLSIVSFAGFGA